MTSLKIETLRRLLLEEVFPYELNPDWERVVNVKVVEAAQRYVDQADREKTIRWCLEHGASGLADSGVCWFADWWRVNGLLNPQAASMSTTPCRVVGAVLRSPKE